jgi:hypothetical protein
MSGYLSVEAFARCPEDGTLAEILGRYRQLLLRLGYAHPHLDEWLAQIRWDPEYDGLAGGVVLEPSPLEQVTFHNLSIQAKALVLGNTPESMPSLGGYYWVDLDLDMDEVQFASQVTDWPDFYFPGAGRPIWQLLRAYGQFLGTYGVYFVSEASDTTGVLEALITEQPVVRWDFEVALIPPALAPRFEPISPEFTAAQVPEGLALARSELWPVLPWDQS